MLPADPPIVGIGIIVPFDFALDREYWEAVRGDVTLFVTRTERLSGEVGVDLAARVADDDGLVRATGSLIEAGPSVVAYACTSGSFVAGLAGEERIRRTIVDAGAPAAVTTSGALIAALDALGLRRIGLAVPYTADVGERLVGFLGEAGVESLSLVSMGLVGGIARVPEKDIMAIARAAMHPDADGLFVSCTNLGTLGLIQGLEDELGVPVLTANQVTMWHALRVVSREPSDRVARQRLFRNATTGGRPVTTA